MAKRIVIEYVVPAILVTTALWGLGIAPFSTKWWIVGGSLYLALILR